MGSLFPDEDDTVQYALGEKGTHRSGVEREFFVVHVWCYSVGARLLKS